MLVDSLSTKNKKDWLVKYLTPLLSIPGSIMTSLIKTAGDKMAALAVVFLQPSSFDF